MKEKELREICDCSFCGKGIGKAGLFFYRVKIEKFGLDLQACQKQQGLGLMMGGHGGLAQIMGPDEDLALEVMEPVTITICGDCQSVPKSVEILAED